MTSDTVEESSSSSTQAALTAYLEPLCAKHAVGETLTYEDLTASKQAADAVLAAQGTTDKTTLSSKKAVYDLHRSQLAAYEAAATTALSTWARTEAVVPPPRADESWADYRIRWWQAVTPPAWKIPPAQMENLVKPVLQAQAMALFRAKRQEVAQAKQQEQQQEHQLQQANVTTAPSADNETKEESTDDVEEMNPEEHSDTHDDDDNNNMNEEEEEGETPDDEVRDDPDQGGEESHGEDEDDHDESEMEDEAEEAADGSTNTKPPNSSTAATRKARPKGKAANKKNAAKKPPRKKGLPNKPLGQSKTVRGRNNKGGGRRGGRAGGSNNNNK